MQLFELFVYILLWWCYFHYVYPGQSCCWSFLLNLSSSVYTYIYVEILPHCFLLLYLFFKVNWFFFNVYGVSVLFGVVNLALPFSVVVFYILYIKKCSLIFISHIEITVLLLTVQTFTVYLPACLKTYLLYVFKNCWML